MKKLCLPAALLLSVTLFLCSCGGGSDETSEAASDTVHMVHNYEKTVIAEPGCEETGIVEYNCICGSSYRETTDITGHDFSVFEVVSPTYFAEGYTVYKCTRCGRTEKRDPTPKLTDSIELPDVPIE